jgi:PAS domain S-box-containing protein
MLPTIIENIPQLVFWKDKNSVFIGCNKKFSDSLGLDSPEDIVGKTDYDVTNVENAKIFIETDKQVISENKPIYQDSQTFKNADNEQLWLNINKVPLHDENGGIIGVLGTIEDITEQVNLENKLRNNNMKYKSLIESTNTAYIILNDSLEIMESNTIFLQIIRATNLYECLGKPLSLWIAPKYQKIYEESCEKLLKGHSVNDLELHLVTETDEIVCVSINANSIENGMTRIFCLLRNIAARKTIESEKYIKEEKRRDTLKQNLMSLRSDIQNIKNTKNIKDGDA